MKANNIYILLFTGFSLYSITSCTEPIDIELDSSFDRLTVYGEISTDTTTHTIRLTRSADYFYNKPAEGLSGAFVKISDGISETALTENTQIPGNYDTPENFYGLPGKTYTLVIQNVDINKDGRAETYSAISYLPFLNEPDSVKVKYANYPFFTGIEVLLYALDPAGSKDFYAFKVSRNGVLQTDSLPEIIVQSDLLFNGNYTNGVSVYFLDDSKPGEKTEAGDTITFEMYGINEEYYNFIIEAQTELFGSNPLFSGPPANILTNINNGAVGFFTAVNIKRTSAIAPQKP